jgi:hypothetical protein
MRRIEYRRYYNLTFNWHRAVDMWDSGEAGKYDNCPVEEDTGLDNRIRLSGRLHAPRFEKQDL